MDWNVDLFIDSKQDDTVPRLGQTQSLRADDEILWSPIVVTSRLLHQRDDSIARSTTATWAMQALEDLFEHILPVNVRGQHAFDVFKDKRCRPVAGKDFEVVLVEVVTMILFRHVMFHSSVSGAPHQGKRLARWASHQNPR
ncbi:hypothetical protein HY57_08565 [Dyella japonica A8]|uniref:Uncharacterized protein n=1 Tax=Dyella japonica A8 TaxID=1217721 RepID=A0A075K0G1_9GAMM|nr:hypothetical protein HY57_08565 [Dyella japonica A8]